MKPTNINLDNPYYAYLFGFIQTDGHLYNNTRDRGRLSIEITNHPVECSMKVLGRSRNSIELRLWRLNKQSKQSVTN